MTEGMESINGAVAFLCAPKILSTPIKHPPKNVARIMLALFCIKSRRHKQPAAAIKKTFSNVLGGTLNSTAKPSAAHPNQKHFSMISNQFIIRNDK